MGRVEGTLGWPTVQWHWTTSVLQLMGSRETMLRRTYLSSFPRWSQCSLFVVQSLSHVLLFVTPWTAAHQAPLSSTVSWSFLKFMSIESVMPSNHLILCCPFLLLPTIFPSIRTFSSESALHIRWPQYWSFNFSIRLSNECSVLISFRIDRFDLLAVQERDS